ncbi:MAG: alpha-L-rhamnosidase N-terminal domain-containing protein [Halobacteriales archaeon]
MATVTSLDDLRTAFPPGREWAARWIWTGEEAQPDNAYIHARAEVSLEEFEAADLHITADTRYELYVNGERIGRGPVQSQPYYKYYDTRDVTESLEPGTNCVGVVVNYTGTMTDTRAGLLAELVVDGEPVLATDGTWQVAPATAWRRDTHATRFNTVTPYQEHYDAREAPQGWTDPGFDAEDWAAAAVISGTPWRDEGADRPPEWGSNVPTIHARRPVKL